MGEDVFLGEGVAHTGDIGGDGTVSEGDERLGVFPDFADFLEVFLVGYGAFDEGDIDVGEVFTIDDGAFDDIGEFSDFEDTFIDIEEGHMAAGAAAQPDGGDFFADHGSDFRFATSSETRWGERVRFPMVASLGQRAPVGQTSIHLPQEVQVAESPQGWLKSAMMREVTPRPATSQLCAPSTSSQVRTQRVQRIQRLWSRTKWGWEASTWSWG
ncbi:MAG: hypothetical protein RI897_3501 [Verrucomicrobiota bacterium]